MRSKNPNEKPQSHDSGASLPSLQGGQASPDMDMASGSPVCPRHRDRVSYVRCQRCNQPVCPQCQRPAAVGVQCVDCVKKQNKAMRSERTVFGAKVRSGPPYVTYSIIALCVIAYIFQLALGWEKFTVHFAFSPLAGAFEPYRFLTTAFLHSQSSIFHIAFNMFALWTVGQALEPAFGRIKFLTLYLVTAIGGSVGYLVLAGEANMYGAVVGASGAVFGLFGVYLLTVRSLGRDSGSIIGILVINGILGFVIPGIAWQAHLGGFLTGLALGAIYIYTPKKARNWASILGTAAVFIGLVVIAIWKYLSLGWI